MSKGRLRWKRNKKATGLAAIGAAPPGYIYHDGERQYAEVSQSGGSWRGPLEGWYWIAGWDSDVPYKNTCASPCDTVEQAMQEAQEYVKQHL